MLCSKVRRAGHVPVFSTSHKGVAPRSLPLHFIAPMVTMCFRLLENVSEGFAYRVRVLAHARMGFSYLEMYKSCLLKYLYFMRVSKAKYFLARSKSGIIIPGDY